MLLTNAFSLNMVAEFPCQISAEEVTVEQARTLAVGAHSAVGHADTAAVYSSVLELPVEPTRATVALKSGDALLVGQYRGPRLPEGATQLPEGATIVWLVVTVK